MPNYCGGIYVDGEYGKLEYFTLYLNGDKVTLVGIQMTNRLERGARETQLRHTGGTVGRDGTGEQEDREGDVRERGG